MTKIIGQNLPNIPWQAPTDDSPVWRYSENPVIDRRPLPGVARIFNSAVVPYGDRFIGVFRGDTETTVPYLYVGESEDGLHFTFRPDRIRMYTQDGQEYSFEYAYDPRVIPMEGVYYIVWCDGMHGAPCIGLAKTSDFTHFELLGHPLMPCNRNGVLFPRRIDGEYLLLSRPSDSGHTRFGDIYLSYSRDLVYWGRHRMLMPRGYEWWQSLKIGAGSAPIETDEGWLLFYHGATLTANGFVYSMGGALLDRDDPTRVLHRCANYLLTPEKTYETVGFVPNVIFPCSALCDADTGRIAIYYGGADTVVGLAFTEVGRVVDYIKKHG